MGWLGTFSDRILLTIDKDKFASTQTGFPVTVFLSISSGIGGRDTTAVFDELVSDANRKKIAITSSDGTTQLYVEIEKWDTAGELAVLHTKVPSISSSADTILYLYYDSSQADNTAFVGDPSDAVVHNVWDANFVAVLHCAESPTGTTFDSTVNANDGSPQTMTAVNLVASQVGDGYLYDGLNDYMFLSNEGDFDFPTDSFTVECIFKSTTIAQGDYVILGKRDSAGNSGYFLRQDQSSAPSDADQLSMWVHDGSYNHVGTGAQLSAGTNYYGAGIYDADNNQSWVSLNDTTYGPTAGIGSPTQNNFPFTVARNAKNDAALEWFPGVIDEIRVSDIERTEGWRSSTYESLFDNAITFGGEVAQTCSYTESDLSSRIRVLLKDTIAREWTDTQISNELKIASEDLSSRSLCVESNSNIITISGTVDYDAPTDTTSVVSCVYDGKGLQRIHPRLVNHLPFDITGSPEYWFYHNGRIGFFPVPDDAYVVNIYFAKVTEDLTMIPCFLRPLLVWHSVARLRGSEGWVDDEALFKKMYDNAVDFSKLQFFTPWIDSLDMFSNG